MNAMTLDIAMGGSTNTVLHLLAIAHEADVDFSMKDIDDLSRKTPVLCKVAPNSNYHIQDVNRAGGILAILGELDNAGLLNTTVHRVDFPSLGDAINAYDIKRASVCVEAKDIYSSAPAGVISHTMGSQRTQYKDLDTDRAKGCIRDIANAYSKDGGIAVLYGNLAQNGCIIKTAGVDESIFRFVGKARVYESQDDAMNGILSNDVVAGDVVIIRYEGPKGGPGMQEMLYPTSYLKSRHLGAKCALITDGRFSGGTSGLSIGHVSPEAAAGGDIALVRNGDEIEIDIPKRLIQINVSSSELELRRKQEIGRADNAFTPMSTRLRHVSKALKLYAHFVSSADTGAIRNI